MFLRERRIVAEERKGIPMLKKFLQNNFIEVYVLSLFAWLVIGYLLLAYPIHISFVLLYNAFLRSVIRLEDWVGVIITTELSIAMLLSLWIVEKSIVPVFNKLFLTRWF